MSRPTRLVFRVPAAASAGLIEVRTPVGAANSAGKFASLTPAQRRPSSRHQPRRQPLRNGLLHHLRPPRKTHSRLRRSHQPRWPRHSFVTGILNATGLTFNPGGDLFVTSRAEGGVYRVDAAEQFTQYVEGMGVATGAVFDAEEISSSATAAGPFSKSIRSARSLFMPRQAQRRRLSSRHQRRRHAFCHRPYTFFEPTPSGLHRAPAIPAVSRPRASARRPSPARATFTLAACLHGRHGWRPRHAGRQSFLVLAASNLVGIAFSPLGTAILTTNEAVMVDLGVEGLNLFKPLAAGF